MLEIFAFSSLANDARTLLSELRGRPPFGALRDEKIVLSSFDEADECLARWQRRFARLAAGAPPQITLPVLLQAIGHSYYGQYRARRGFLGPALKLSVAAVWPNVFDAAPADPRWCIRDLIEHALVVEQLEIFRSAFFQARSGTIEMSAEGTSEVGAVAEMLTAFSVAFADRGECLRLADETTRTILCDSPRVLHGVHRVLRGDPRPIAELDDCWLAKLAPTEPRAFWEQLAARLHLFVLLEFAVAKSGLSPDAIFMFGDIAMPVAEEFEALIDMINPQPLFWQREWLSKLDRRELRNAIVERPILRIGHDPTRYCTSLTLVGDALNWFVETSVIRQHGSSGVPLSHQCFRQLLSGPFERRVQEIMRTMGFRAGTVTEKGTWQSDVVMNLGASAGPPPGEIDVLAVRDDGLVMVIECKVLAMPHNEERMRNLLGKLGTDDAELIHAKLRRKREWVRRVAPQLIPRFEGELGLIVLDRRWPGITVDGDQWVVDADALADALSALGHNR